MADAPFTPPASGSSEAKNDALRTENRDLRAGQAAATAHEVEQARYQQS